MHDKNLHINSSLSSNFPEPELSADFAWDKMILLLDSNNINKPPEHSLTPENGSGNHKTVLFSIVILCIVGLVLWWFSTNSNPQNISPKKADLELKNNKIQAESFTEKAAVSNNDTAGNTVINKSGSALIIQAISEKNSSEKITTNSKVPDRNIGTKNRKFTSPSDLNAKKKTDALFEKSLSGMKILVDSKSSDSSLVSKNNLIFNLEKVGNNEKNSSMFSAPVDKNDNRTGIIKYGKGSALKYSLSKTTNKISDKNEIVKARGSKDAALTDQSISIKNRKKLLKKQPVLRPDNRSNIDAKDKNSIIGTNSALNADELEILKNKESLKGLAAIKNIAKNIDLENNRIYNNSNLIPEILQKIKAVYPATIISHTPFVEVNIAAINKNNSVNAEQPAGITNKKSLKKDSTGRTISTLKNSTQNSFVKSINYGLQWTLPIPTQPFNNYFTGTNGKSQPYLSLIPSFWISKKIKNQQLLFSFNLLQQNLTRNKLLSTSSGPASATDSSIVINNTSLNKTFGMAIGLQYNYSLSPLFSLGFGINYNLQQSALLNKVTILDATGKTIADSSYILKGSSLTDVNLNRSIIAAKLEFTYTKKRFAAGANLSAPLTNFSSKTAVNIKPLTGQLFLRWKIKK